MQFKTHLIGNAMTTEVIFHNFP